jgi:hypothetical protein
MCKNYNAYVSIYIDACVKVDQYIPRARFPNAILHIT